MTAAKIRTHAPDFSKEEISVIIAFYKKHSEFLSSKFTSAVTLRKKKTLYDELTSSVNGTSSASRSVNAIKDKWQNMQRQVRRKVAEFLKQQRSERGKTGGGVPLVDVNAPVESILTSQEMEIYYLLPSQTIGGIAGAVESVFEPTACGSTSEKREPLPSEQSIPCFSPKSTCKRPRLTPTRQKMASDDYYAEMISIERAKLEEMQRHHLEIETTNRLNLAELQHHNREMERIPMGGYRYNFPASDQIPQHPWNCQG